MTVKELASKIQSWIIRSFGSDVFTNPQERGRRFLEEAIELNQAIGVSQEDALRLVNYVYSRPVGVVEQELGGVGITLLGLCSSLKLDFEDVTTVELNRVNAFPVSHFRKRHALKVEAGISLASTEKAA
jgi:hypothetical protein